jgi:ribosome-associated protein
MDPLSINATLSLPAEEISFRAVRAGGPGGQNVNKVSSKVELSFALDASAVLSDDVKMRLRTLAGSRLTLDGRLLVVSQLTRDQHKNLADAREKLRALVLQALEVPVPRKATKVPKGVRRRRVADKRKAAARRDARRIES